MIVLPLSSEDQMLARLIGRRRNALKQANGINSNKHSDAATDLDIHILGASAEVAVARWLGVPVNADIYLSGDGGIDLTYQGVNIDVKMRSAWGKDLLVMPDLSDFRAEVALLCWPGKEPDTVAVVGLVSRERFRRKALDTVLVRPPRLVMPWQELTRIVPEALAGGR